MKVRFIQEDYYGLYIVDVSDKPLVDAYDVPPRFLNALQKAQNDVEMAERDIVKHLLKTGQIAEDDPWVRKYGGK